MSNRVYVTVKEERYLDSDLKPSSEPEKSVYINCDGISACLGWIDTKEDLMNLVSPTNIMDSMNAMLSCDELDVLIPVLEFNNGEYSIFNEKYQVEDL